ncbi:aldo/keto reductase [Rhodobacterales bacterium FZCC0188]|nr:aldo/keto reductase [Rhodobacterales bacterium FZCC0188]
MKFSNFKTGSSLSTLGLGTVKFGRTEQLKYHKPFSLPSLRQVQELLEIASSLGVNYLDTAPAYGFSEQLIGQAVGANYGYWHVGTKLGENFDGVQSSFDFSRKGAEVSLSRSLRLLGKIVPEYVLLHSNGDDLNALHSEALNVLREYKDRGYIKSIGASVKTKEGVAACLQLGVDVVMVEVNKNNPDLLKDANIARNSGVDVVVKKALASGYIAPKEAFDWLIANVRFSSVLIGSINPEHLKSNVRWFLS